MMKNCEPLLLGPLLAIESTPFVYRVGECESERRQRNVHHRVGYGSLAPPVLKRGRFGRNEREVTPP